MAGAFTPARPMETNEKSSVDRTAVKRLFVGSLLPPDRQEELGSLSRCNQELSTLWQRKLRWVNAIKLHMTWFFLGDVPTEQTGVLIEALSGLSSGAAAAEISYDNIEIWPSIRKPRQLVLTPAKVPSCVEKLAKSIRSELRGFAVKPDDRKFRPHITLLRFDLADKGASNIPIAPPDWFLSELKLPLIQTVDRVELIESNFTGSGDYEVIKQFRLSC